MNQIDTSISNRVRRPGAGMALLAQGIRDYRRGSREDLMFEQQQINLQNQRRKQEKAADFERRKVEYQKALALDPMMTQETRQDLESRIFQPELLEQRLRGGLRGAKSGVAKDNWINLGDGWMMNKATGERVFDKSILETVSPESQATIDYKKGTLKNNQDKFAYKQKNDLKEFIQDEANDVEAIRQFGIKQAVEAKKYNVTLKKFDWEINKHKTMHQFKQKNQLKRLPKYISSTFANDRTVDVKDVDKIIKLNDSFSNMYNKFDNIEEVIGSEKDFIDSKGAGVTAKRAKSRIEKVVLQYNTDIVKLGALAGSDLSMLRGIVPDPTAWELLTYDAWKATMLDLKEDLKEEYQLNMSNAGFNVSGEELGGAVGRATLRGSAPVKEETVDEMTDSIMNEEGI